MGPCQVVFAKRAEPAQVHDFSSLQTANEVARMAFGTLLAERAPPIPVPSVRPCSLSAPSAPAFCWKSLEGLWTDLCSSLPSLLTFCVAWRKPLGSCKSQFPQEQDAELTTLLQEWDSTCKGRCQLSSRTPVSLRTFDILFKSSCKELPCVVYSV